MVKQKMSCTALGLGPRQRISEKKKSLHISAIGDG